VTKIREILTPVIVGNIQREHPDADPASIAATISDEQLLGLASYAGPFFAEAQQAGIDLQEWRLQPSTPASAVSAPPTPPQAPQSPVVPMEVDTPMLGPFAPRSVMVNDALDAGNHATDASTAPLDSEARTTHPAREHGGAPTPTINNEETRITTPGNSASPKRPAAEPPRAAQQLHKVYRTLCTLTGLDVLSTVALSFELAITEVASVMRWAQRYQEIEYVLRVRHRLIHDLIQRTKPGVGTSMPYVALSAERPCPASRWGGRVWRSLAHMRKPLVPPS
jgi:hypothetical protein